ncbi:nuclear transport factor 2 family protein [Dehalococcoides mccartyi]|jgi:ketosteroid isomerase-like protein|uniref:nuclear transport factor 2 family protein n=1 Tax=Dehalococcoides mccartyi TaxID=61435 RepID=UPI0003C83AFC|nr:nuclear transport factor 2 family protein [Dehalococcoides mccartyi]AHB12828.1 hypothetical protein GY50_0041 [Dehalococcoides mccartyi GY50]AII57261.1 hypothetical protein X792_00205 [Dehalococcoides mccartyi CG1]APH11788.1 hypothetical protein ASJ33_00785 [Dehalococcoides mccartyi]
MKIDPEVRKEINQVLDAMKEAIETKDMEALVALVESEPNVLTVGPCPDNVGLGQNGFKRWMQTLLDKATPVKFKYGFTTIKGNGPVAWLDTHVTYTCKNGENQKDFDFYLSGVMEKADNGWHWSGMHLSAPTELEFPEGPPPQPEAEKPAEEPKPAAENEAAKPEQGEDAPPEWNYM